MIFRICEQCGKRAIPAMDGDLRRLGLKQVMGFCANCNEIVPVYDK